MQMINVLKRLQELDEKNPRVVKESQLTVEECGMLGMGGMNQPHTPASINMTANSGPELTGMLKDIMSLAGLKPVGDNDLGNEPPPAIVSTEPGMSVANVNGDQSVGDDGMAGNDTGEEPFDMKNLVAKIDTLNEPADDQEEKIKEWDNEPTDDVDGQLDNDAMLNTGMHNQDPAGNPGVGDRMDGDRPRAFTKDAAYESLMAEYQKFINEDKEEDSPFADLYNENDVDEHFDYFDRPKTKGKRANRNDDQGHDELARRAELRPNAVLGHAKDYKEKNKYTDYYQIKGPKGKLPENDVKDGERAHAKIHTPAVTRKAQGGDWKVTKKDLETEPARTGTSPEGLDAIKKLAGLK
jgi:hypothetical protein